MQDKPLMNLSKTQTIFKPKNAPQVIVFDRLIPKMAGRASLRRDKGAALPTSNQPIPFTTSYACDWQPSDAFRELYQNWKDEIMDKHRISIFDFRPFVKETNESISIVIQNYNETRRGRKIILGFIRFEKSDGMVILTNCGAALDPQCLELGYSTKLNDCGSAISKGLGLKIAALVLTREDYLLRVNTNDTLWKFALRGRGNRALRFSISTTSKKENGEQTKTADTPESSTGDCLSQTCEDVSVTIKGRVHQKYIGQDEFWEWMRITIDINPPHQILKTVAGDLIMSPGYAGSIYHRGVLSPPRGKRQENAFQYGYNFLVNFNYPGIGEDINRRLRSRLIADIWSRAIASGYNGVIEKYTELLQNHPCAEDAISAEDHVDEPTARSIWSHLATIASTQGLFYCVNDVHQFEKQDIREALHLEPSLLSPRLWLLLRKYSLVSTLQERVTRVMLSGTPLEIPTTLFAQEVDRAICALLAADPITAGVKVIYVFSPLNMNRLAFHAAEDLLFVSSSWLDIVRAHSLSHCVADLTRNEFMFCDHIPEELYNRALFAIAAARRESGEIISAQAILALFSRARDKLRDMPRKIQSFPLTDCHTIAVKWENGHSSGLIGEVGMLSYYRVVLHSLSCIEQREVLLFSRILACDCPSQTVSLEENAAFFQFLDTQPRFPVVSRCLENSICGVPPPAIFPCDNTFAPTGSPRKFVLQN